MVGRTILSPPSGSTMVTRRVKDNAPYLCCIVSAIVRTVPRRRRRGAAANGYELLEI